MVADEQKEAIAVKRLQRALKLFLPINLPFCLEFVSVEHSLCCGRFNQSAEILGLALVVVLHFLINAGADQLPHGHAFRKAIQGEGVGLLARSGFVVNRECGRHNYFQVIANVGYQLCQAPSTIPKQSPRGKLASTMIAYMDVHRPGYGHSLTIFDQLLSRYVSPRSQNWPLLRSCV